MNKARSYDVTTGVFLTATDTWAEIFKCLGSYDIIKVIVAMRKSDNTAVGNEECRIITNSNLVVVSQEYNGTFKFKLMKDADNYYHFYVKSTYNSSYVSASVEYTNNINTMEIKPIVTPDLLPAYTDVTSFSTQYNLPKSISIVPLYVTASGWTRSTTGQVQYRDGRIFGTLMIGGATSGGTVADDTVIGTVPAPLYTNTESMFLQIVGFYTDSSGIMKPCLIRIIGTTGELKVRNVGADCGASTNFYVPLNYETGYGNSRTLLTGSL